MVSGRYGSREVWSTGSSDGVGLQGLIRIDQYDSSTKVQQQGASEDGSDAGGVDGESTRQRSAIGSACLTSYGRRAGAWGGSRRSGRHTGHTGARNARTTTTSDAR